MQAHGKKELVASLVQKSVWRLEPGAAGARAWTTRVVDVDSSRFEHATNAADREGDGRQELYVANDDGKSTRRYVRNGRRLVKVEITQREDDRSILTWNVVPIPIALVPE
jgi:hypothetical protein